MTDTDKIVTAARRYCLDNYKYWMEKYRNERTGKDFPYTYTDSDYNLFPRYQALDAILKGIGIVVGKIFSSNDACKEELKSLAFQSQTLYTAGKHNDIQKKAIEEERQKFVNFIDQLDINLLGEIIPLPYMRTLSKEESVYVRNELRSKWNFDGGYWNPLATRSPEPIIFFDTENLSDNDFRIIKEITTQSTQIYQINEIDFDYEIDDALIDFDQQETIFTDRNYEWIIYLSHEDTISFGGAWLLKEIELRLPHKAEFINQW